MSQPIWITPAGSIGVIPEGIFFQQTLLATTDPLPNQPTCTATSASTNLITCSSTAGVRAGQNVTFEGELFGVVNANVRYFVLEVVSNTQFSITTTEFSSTPITLTNATGSMTAVFREHVYYKVIAGALPGGVQLSDNGIIVGIPQAVASLQGVPLQVSQDVTNKFTIRGYTNTVPQRIRDRTFTLTVTGNDVPEFITPAGSLGTYYDGDKLDIQIGYTDTDPDEIVTVRLIGGELPLGTTLSPTGLLSGYIRPATNVNEPPGYDFTASDTEPYDFVTNSVSRNYQFTLEVTDGKSNSIRTFEIFVYDRATMTADNTQITSDSTTVTADESTTRTPFIINAEPSNLGIVRGDNYYSYQFIGNDYDTPTLKYAISINEGEGLPPGLTLDNNSGWYYGYIPDQGITQVEYSFNVVTYQADFVGLPITCTATTFGTDRITCADTSALGVGQPIIFTGTTFGGIVASPLQVYYVASIVSSTQFTITANLFTNITVPLTNGSGTMTANLIVASEPVPYTLTISGAVDAEVTWITPTNLGVLDNGDISLLKVEAVNRGGRELLYRLKEGAFNELPQGLQLLPTGEISGQVSFDTFSVDLGATTFDQNTTTWDSSFTFTVNAYAEDTSQILYRVSEIIVVNGGTNYSTINTPVISISSPVGASASTAIAGTVTIDNTPPGTTGPIQEIALDNDGGGYTSPATVTVTEGFGGFGAELEAKMEATGVRDVVSVDKTFTVRVRREYNKPYQNLVVHAMPPALDRELVNSLLDNQQIFIPDFIFRPDDPYFGKSTQVTYDHAYGLEPDSLDRYVESLYKNHYWKNLVLGEISTAQAVDNDGNVIYEVVYSKIVDNLVNAAGESVSKIVNLAYPIDTEITDGTIRQVYPNSLVNMRDQVIDVVGQISTKLPLWMTSKQENGRVLGFTPAWVLCYTKPGKSKQIAYYIQTQFGNQLNRVDFKVDRYVLDRSMSRNWDTTTQRWTPQANLTTFDRFSTGGNQFIGSVEIATTLAYSDVDNRTIEYINNLGGLDGIIGNINGNKIIFVKQEDYSGPPGSAYPTVDAAWQKYLYPYDTIGFSADGTEFDQAVTVPSSPVNERMAIYRINVNPLTSNVTLTLDQLTNANDYVQITRGSFYRSAQLFRPTSPGQGLTRISWLPLTTVVTTETIFDQGSMAFVDPVDMYDPTDRYDKYLVFPKTNILA
jgi:hypothetical protein